MNENELMAWYVCSILAIALNFITLLIAVINCWRYIYDKGIRRLFILLFYASVFIVTVSSIIIGIYLILDPGKTIIEDTPYVYCIKAISLAFLYWTVGLSMF